MVRNRRAHTVGQNHLFKNYNGKIEKLSFYSLSSEKKTKYCSRNFGEHLAAIFRGMCEG